MKLTPTPLPGVVIVEPAVFEDHRGWFMESWNEAKFATALAELGLPAPGHFLQDNHSVSRRGVVRGLHYQLPPHPQGKLVRVVQGRAWDVAVDVRRSSPHFGRWFGLELTPANRRQLWIPPGFAHGFVALEDDTVFLYKITGAWARDCERAIRWNDPELGIAWPLPVGCTPVLAAKDADAPPLAQADTFE